MREILFRGKQTDNKKWVVDNSVLFFKNSTKIYGALNEWREVEVIPETVGQYTGLTDKNGTKIFEGDIVNYNGTNHKVVFETRGESAYFGIEISNIETWRFCLEVPAKLMNVVGNIYDNPELLRSDTE